jgi:hypothetical protein
MAGMLSPPSFPVRNAARTAPAPAASPSCACFTPRRRIFAVMPLDLLGLDSYTQYHIVNIRKDFAVMAP